MASRVVGLKASSLYAQTLSVLTVISENTACMLLSAPCCKCHLDQADVCVIPPVKRWRGEEWGARAPTPVSSSMLTCQSVFLAGWPSIIKPNGSCQCRTSPNHLAWPREQRGMGRGLFLKKTNSVEKERERGCELSGERERERFE